MRKFGFTLAEVLITLGIIGVVSAITIPTLIQSYRNHVVETRLQKVYSVMNQAIQRAEADYGAKELWDFEDPDFWNKYFAPYLNVLKTEIIKSNYDYRIIYFPDGSALAGKASGSGGYPNTGSGMNSDYFFFPNAKYLTENALNTDRKVSTGVILFPFRFAPNYEIDNSGYKSYTYHKGFVPYTHNWDGTVENLTTGYYACTTEGGINKMPNFCTMYIMQNGWKIPKDYPFKVK